MITEVPPNSPGFYSKKSFRRVASSHRSKESERPHFRMFTTNSVLSSVRKGDYAFKIDLQDAYFHVPIHPSSRKYVRFPFKNKVYQFQVLPCLNTAPQVFTRLGHTVTAYLHRQGISVIKLVGFVLNRKKSELDLTRDLQFLGICLRPESKAWEICTRTPSILPPCTILYSSVLADGVPQLGLGSYPSGSFAPETPSTSFSFVRSDRPVYATTSIRPSGPCQPSAALAGPTFSYLRNPSPNVSGGFHDFYGRLHAGVGRSHGGFPDFGYLDPYRPQTPHQLFGAQSCNSYPTALGSSAPGPPGHDRYGQFDSSFIYQQTRRDPFPHLVVVDGRTLLLWLEAQNISPSKAYPRLSERDSRPLRRQR